jgi:hypothetical protein
MAGKFYRIKEGSSFNPFVYGMENLPTPWEDLEETTFELAFDGSLKGVCFGVSTEELKALIAERDAKADKPSVKK